MRRALGRLTSVLARAVDPMRSLATAAGLVHGACAGVLLHEDGRITALPGPEDHALLAADSPALAAARVKLDAGDVYRSFLWPRGRPATKASWVFTRPRTHERRRSGDRRADHSLYSGGFGSTARPKVDALTPARHAYQATAAVTSPR
jgi:hypothetical protein